MFLIAPSERNRSINIAPNMGTMLSFVLTDAAVDKQTLQQAWEEVTADTFNRVTVDSDTSTNDSAFVMANGKAGNPVIESLDTPEGAHFKALLYTAVNPLAKITIACLIF